METHEYIWFVSYLIVFSIYFIVLGRWVGRLAGRRSVVNTSLVQALLGTQEINKIATSAPNSSYLPYLLYGINLLVAGLLAHIEIP